MNPVSGLFILSRFSNRTENTDCRQKIILVKSYFKMHNKQETNRKTKLRLILFLEAFS